MSTARVLPANLAPRFARARRAHCTAGDTSFELLVAEGFGLRLRGLSWLDPAAIVPLLFPRCRSLHTFGMRAPIDVVWLDLDAEGKGQVLAVDDSVASRRMTRAPGGSDRRRTAALELAAGEAGALGLRTGARVATSREL